MRSPGSCLGCRRLEGERNRPWSESIFRVRHYIAKHDMSDMSGSDKFDGLRLDNLSSSDRIHPTSLDIRIYIFCNIKVLQVHVARA
jgi:hypothetical protein